MSELWRAKVATFWGHSAYSALHARHFILFLSGCCQTSTSRWLNLLSLVTSNICYYDSLNLILSGVSWSLTSLFSTNIAISETSQWS